MIVLFATDANYEATLDLLKKLQAQAADERGREILDNAHLHQLVAWNRYHDGRQMKDAKIGSRTGERSTFSSPHPLADRGASLPTFSTGDIQEVTK